MNIKLEKNGEKLEKDIYSQIYFIIHMFIPIGFFMVAFMGRKKGHTKRYVMTNILYHSIVLIVLTPLFLIQLPFFQYLFLGSIFLNALMIMYFMFYIEYWDLNHLLEDGWVITNQKKDVIEMIEKRKQPKWVVG